MANPEALSRIGWMLGRMRAAAEAKGAPVYAAEAATEGDPFKILVFTMLSARTKDATTIRAVESLFREADTPDKVAALGQERLEELLYGVGFYRVKSRHLLSICRALAGSGRFPDTEEALLELPGIGRKTANIVLARAFGRRTLGVDVHVHRISNRLGLVRTKKPEETERALLRIVPPRFLRRLNRDFVAFGQTVCLPRRPGCSACPLNRLCLRAGVREPCPECRHGKGAGAGVNRREIKKT